jgi:hypothetical protein
MYLNHTPGSGAGGSRIGAADRAAAPSGVLDAAAERPMLHRGLAGRLRPDQRAGECIGARQAVGEWC